MKGRVLLAAVISIMAAGTSSAAFVSGSTGVDGVFSPTANTELQLPPDGIFNFTTVNVPSGVTVTFRRNANNTPVYILATGSVTIAGTIKVDGTAPTGNAVGGAGGPGGFDGGAGGAPNMPGSNGIGPGGGTAGTSSCRYGAGGGFGTAGGPGTSSGTGGTTCAAGGPVYGNRDLQPMIGGSGGGGYQANSTCGGGGGGGGAVVIASSETITLTGFVTARGGSRRGYPCSSCYGGGGSGGAIKLVAGTITGIGTLDVSGGDQSSTCTSKGGNGRIMIQADTRDFAFNLYPSSVEYTYTAPKSVFVPNSPTLRIMSIGGVSIPASTTGSFASPDIWLPSTTTNPVAVTIAAAYIPVGTIVTVSVVPQYSTATNVSATLGGTLESSTASTSVTIPSGSYPSVVTAYATFSLQSAMFWEGERIDRVKIASSLGGTSETVYITESGREIRGELIAGLLK